MPSSLPLTKPHGEQFERARAATHPGMACWAGGGPSGFTCRECEFFQTIQGRFAKTNKKAPDQYKPGKCNKFYELTGSDGDRVPHTAISCKYFERSSQPRPLTVKYG